MKTAIILLAALAVAIAPGVTALNTASVLLLPGDEGGEDTCDGIYELDGCTCEWGTVYCDEGHQCAKYVLNYCVEGGNAVLELLLNA